MDVTTGFGVGHWSGCKVQVILQEIVVSVSSPGFLASHPMNGAAAELRRLPLLHLESMQPERWLSWKNWVARNNLLADSESHDLTLNNYHF